MQVARGVCNVHNVIDKSVHKRKRRVVGQGLSDQSVRSFEPTTLIHVEIFLRKLMTSFNADELNNHWSKPVNMTRTANQLLFDIMGDFAFGQSLELQSKADNRFFIDAVNAVNHRFGIYFQYPSLAKLKLKRFLYLNIAVTLMKYGQLMNQLGKTRVSTDIGTRRDFFSFTGGVRDSEGFTEKELWSESRFLLVAGKRIR